MLCPINDVRVALPPPAEKRAFISRRLNFRVGGENKK